MDPALNVVDLDVLRPAPSSPPPPAAAVMRESQAALAALSGDGTESQISEAAHALIEAAVRAGAATWDFARREQLRGVISFWEDVLSDRLGERVDSTVLTSLDSDLLPRLDPASRDELFRLVRAGEPVVARSFEGFSLAGLGPAEGQILKFIDCSFRDCDFAGVDLTGARLLYSSLTACELVDVSMEGAVVTSSLFGGGTLKPRARGATFSGARFEGASMKGGEFAWCSFASASFEDVDASDATFDESLFDRATLRDVNFDEASLVRTVFVGASVEAIFSGADLSGSIFSSADVHGADFRGATLTGASFAKALDVSYAQFDAGSETTDPIR